MKTRAAVARQAGTKLSLETVDLKGPRAGEVLVDPRYRHRREHSQRGDVLMP